VSAARDAEVVIVVVGTNEAVESEGFDRESLGLPGFQDRLVHEVARVNPRTVVVVNAGSPVVLPWRDEVAAVLLGYFGGQGMGAAIAAIVTGAEEPGGRLTTTWPALESDLPVSQVTPTDGVLDYSEGLHIGYRGWLRGPHQPAYPFGWGLGYTTWSLEGAWTADSDVSDELLLGVAVRNTGIRAGKQVIQVYAERPGSAIERPIRWLVGSAVVRLDAGASEDVPVRIRSRAFSHWDECTGSWKQERGEFTLRIGTSVDDLPLSLTIDPSLAELNQ
jgi:beta-glucosidase